MILKSLTVSGFKNVKSSCLDFTSKTLAVVSPNNENPNLFSIGEGFGFFVFFGNDNSGSFQTAVCPKPYQKKDRITKVTTVKVP